VLFKQGETRSGPGNEAPAKPLPEGSEGRETVTREVRHTSDDASDRSDATPNRTEG